MAKVTSSNPFDLLGEGDFDGEINPSKLVAKKASPAPKQLTTAPRKPQENRTSKAPQKSNKTQASSAVVGDDFQGVKSQGFKDKKAPKARGNPKGRGREFDRHSGTGKVDSEKAINQGWGHATENLDEVAKPEFDSKEDETPEEKPVDPEDSFKTLEEYYAEVKAQKAESAEAKALRQANEGVDDSKWKDAKPLVKEEEDFFSGKSSSKARKNKEKSGKTLLEIEQTFNVSQDRRGDRRPTRGSNRGGRGSDRAPRNSNTRTVSLADESAFPSL